MANGTCIRPFDAASCKGRRELFRNLCANTERPLIKCCGMFRSADIDATNGTAPDFAGFIWDFPKSHRNVNADEAKELVSQLSPKILSVAVTVNKDPKDIAELAGPSDSNPIFDIVQLHGDENEETIAQIRRLTDAPLIQAFRVHSEEDVIAACESSADMILLDSGQGSGEAFDWTVLKPASRPFMLAGGLNPDVITQAIEQTNPWGLDLSSGLETNRLKDPEKIKNAVQAVHAFTSNNEAKA